jgi:hypothetical protein
VAFLRIGILPDFLAAMYVESVPYAAGASAHKPGKEALLAAPAALASPQRLAEAATELPYDQGLYVSQVGRGAPKPKPATAVLLTDIQPAR